MKKILLLSAVALASLTASAQSVSVTVMGKEVANGETVNANCLESESGSQTMPNGQVINYTLYMLNPEVYATSSKTSQYTITVKNVTTEVFDPMQSFQFCWPVQCVFLSPGEETSQTGTLEAGTPADLEIHTATWENQFDQDFTLSATVEIVDNNDSSNKYSFNLNMNYVAEDAAAVEEVAVDNDAPKAYYDLTGRQVLNPAKGQIVIERQGGNVRKVVM